MIPLLSTILSLSNFAPIIQKWIQSTSNDHDLDHITSMIIGIAQKITKSKTHDDMLKELQESKILASKFQDKMTKMDEKIQKIILNDRKDARCRDMSLIQAGKINKRADFMVVCAAIGLLICLVTIGFFSHKISGEAIGIISTIAGLFGSCLKDAYGFEFGSSRGSKEKDNVLYRKSLF